MADPFEQEKKMSALGRFWRWATQPRFERVSKHPLFTPVVTAALTGIVTWQVTQSQERTKVRENLKVEAMNDLFAGRAGRPEEIMARLFQARTRALLLSEGSPVPAALGALGKQDCFAWSFTAKQAAEMLGRCSEGYAVLFNAYREELKLEPLPLDTVRSVLAYERFVKDYYNPPMAEALPPTPAPPSAPAPSTSGPAPSAIVPSPTSFMVFFDFQSRTLSGEALKVLGQAVTAYRREAERIDLVGHSDTAEEESIATSLRRSNQVKDVLIAAGVPAAVITVIGKGSTQLLVPTPDKVREPQNRRVEILLSR